MLEASAAWALVQNVKMVNPFAKSDDSLVGMHLQYTELEDFLPYNVVLFIHISTLWAQSLWEKPWVILHKGIKFVLVKGANFKNLV